MHQPVENIGKAADKVVLANLYLQHVLSFIGAFPIRTSTGAMVAADERLMRLFEWEAGIPEENCFVFRKTVARQFQERRMDLLYDKLGEVCELLAQFESNKMRNWCEYYPHAIATLYKG